MSEPIARRCFTSDINGASCTSYAIRIIFDDVACLEDSLDGASLDIELGITEAIPPVAIGPVSQALLDEQQIIIVIIIIIIIIIIVP